MRGFGKEPVTRLQAFGVTRARATVIALFGLVAAVVLSLLALPSTGEMRADAQSSGSQFSGRWVGHLTLSYGTLAITYKYELQLIQNGTAISGTSRITDTQHPQEYGVKLVQGMVVSDTAIDIQETQIIESSPDLTWCLVHGRLQLSSSSSGGVTLAGVLNGAFENGRACTPYSLSLTPAATSAATSAPPPAATPSPTPPPTPTATPPPPAPTMVPSATSPPDTSTAPAPAPTEVPPPLQPPDAPSDLAATLVDPTTIQLTWTSNSTNEDGFQIWDVAGQTVVTGTPAGVTSFTLSGLPPNQIYCFAVYAFNAAGNSDFSNQVCATTPP